ncbi:hypothetical protein J6590_096788, partial [Homalodisca vitripennis]
VGTSSIIEERPLGGGVTRPLFIQIRNHNSDPVARLLPYLGHNRYLRLVYDV